MRIVAGRAKGTRLASVPPSVRPLSDRAREGLFASLGELVREARVLDLYAGTGACGIEALSRRAASAVFVDKAAPAVEAVKENLRRTRLEDLGVVVRGSCRTVLERDARAAGPFDLVLCDPPYDLSADALAPVLLALDAGRLAAPGWTVVCTRATRSSTLVVPVHWAAWRQLRYGDSLVSLYREEAWA